MTRNEYIVNNSDHSPRQFSTRCTKGFDGRGKRLGGTSETQTKITQTDMTTEEKAKAYAEKADYPAPEYGWYESDHEAMTDVLEQAYLAGATEALASKWKEVDADNPETLPKEKQTVLCRLDDGEFLAARFDRINTFDLDGEEYNVVEWSVGNGFESYTLGDEITHWLPIPPLKGGDE